MIPSVRNINQVNLGRIVPPPLGGSDLSPTYFPARLFILGAGAAGLAANVADKASNVALQRSNETNTASPNPVSNVGSAGSTGLPGDSVGKFLRIIQPTKAITGPQGAAVSTTVQKLPSWVKPALLIAAGIGIGALVFRG